MQQEPRSPSPIRVLGLTVLFALVLPACKFLAHQIVETVRHVDRWANGTPKREGDLEDGLQAGKWTYFYEDGRRRAQGPYAEDHQVGAWTYWYESGNVEWTGGFDQAGHRAGHWTFWYDDDVVVRGQGRYLADQEEGFWEFYGPDGRVARRGGYDRAKRSGFWRDFYPSGAKRSAGVYHRGKKIGAWRFWEENGIESGKDCGVPGGLTIAWGRYPDGAPRRVGVMQGDTPIGTWTSFHPGGDAVRISCTFDADGETCGAFVAMRSDGTRCADGAILDGEFSADCREFEAGRTVAKEMIAGPIPQLLPGAADGWTEPDFAERNPSATTVATWLAELRRPVDEVSASEQPATPLAELAPSQTQLAALDDQIRIPAPMQPEWTIVQIEEMDGYVADYLEGKSKKRVSRRRYGVAGEARRVGGPRRRTELEGKRLPVTEFTAVDGTVVDTEALRGKKRILLVVLRGFAGEVCVYCVAQTEALAQCRESFDDLGLEVLVVYPGPVGNEQAFLDAYETTFGKGAPPYKVFYDPDLKLVSQLGIEGGDLAYPTTLIVDKDGVVDYAYVGEHRADRPAAKKLIEVIRGMDKDESK